MRSGTGAASANRANDLRGMITFASAREFGSAGAIAMKTNLLWGHRSRDQGGQRARRAASTGRSGQRTRRMVERQTAGNVKVYRGAEINGENAQKPGHGDPLEI